MESSVFFKFKSNKEPTRVEFDGTGISVFELKREIILKSALGDGTDFDLVIAADEGFKEGEYNTQSIFHAQNADRVQSTMTIQRLFQGQPRSLPAVCPPRCRVGEELLAMSRAKCLYMQRIRHEKNNRSSRPWLSLSPTQSCSLTAP